MNAAARAHRPRACSAEVRARPGSNWSRTAARHDASATRAEPPLRVDGHASTTRRLTARCCAAASGWATSYMDGLVGHRRPRRADPHRGAQRPPLRRAAPRASGRCSRPCQRGRRARCGATPSRAPRADRRALRPRQRPLRAVPRRDDDVLGRASSTTPGTPLHEAQVAKLDRICRQARPAARRPPAGDRHRLGRARRPRRRALRRRVTTTTISREQHALATAARPRRPGWRTASPSCSRTTATLDGHATTSSSRSR